MRFTTSILFPSFFLSVTAFLPYPSLSLAFSERPHPRSAFLARLSGSTLGAFIQPMQNSQHQATSAFAMSLDDNAKNNSESGGDRAVKKIVAYHPLTINVKGVMVPVAVWHPAENNNAPDDYLQSSGRSSTSSGSAVSYNHRISVKKIGKLLAGLNFIPSFAYRDFPLDPSSDNLNTNIQVISSGSSTAISSANSANVNLPSTAPVVILAHGYLGSRFDLSHLGETLASEGFLVLSPEYPESLADSYDPLLDITSGRTIDRTLITNELLSTLTSQWKVQPTAFGIVGHSLGCGTVERTGDDSWSRVCLAGYPSSRGSSTLFVGSTNDGAVPLSRAMEALGALNFVSLEKDQVIRTTGQYNNKSLFPKRSYLIFDGDNAPNHISFLAEGTCDAMVEFLSPLLPVARGLGIPLLDFDKYQVSRDSRQTGEVLLPLVVEYLKQTMQV